MLLILVTIFSYAIYIRYFNKIRQYEREEGLRRHQLKSGTVTMGGIIFMLIPLFFIPYSNNTIGIVLTMISFAILGFFDDLLIIIKKNNDGLKPLFKLIIEIIISAIFYILFIKKFNLLYFIFIIFFLTSSVNAFNLTDGIDGLCSGLSIIMSIPFIYIAYKKGMFDVMYLLVAYSLAIFVFWCFNLPKAYLFMGDVGSLGLGALYSLVSIYLNEIKIFILLSIIFIFEVVSVLIQVIYYKKTKKRIFKMSPFHHHLESIGYSENKIDLIFYLIEILLSIITIICYK